MPQEGSSRPPDDYDSLTSQKRGVPWGWIVAGLIVAAVISFFFMKSVDGTVQYYMTVSEYFERQSKYEGKRIKIAGRVKAGSLEHRGKDYKFKVEDQGKEVQVNYQGIAPDTFKEGIEVVVEGRGQSGDQFEASELMAKCASKYQEGAAPSFEQMRGRSIR